MVGEPKRDATASVAEEPAMAPFADSKDLVDKDMLMDVRSRTAAICAARGWFKPGTDAIDAITVAQPSVEGEERYFEVYDEIQKLEAFHAVPHHPTVRAYMTALLGDSAFPHPLSIARLSFPSNETWTTPPHQDYPNNQGTEDLYASWIPLSACPVELGGLSILRGSHKFGVAPLEFALGPGDRKSTRLNSSHITISYAVFCLKKKK